MAFAPSTSIGSIAAKLSKVVVSGSGSVLARKCLGGFGVVEENNCLDIVLRWPQDKVKL